MAISLHIICALVMHTKHICSHVGTPHIQRKCERYAQAPFGCMFFLFGLGKCERHTIHMFLSWEIQK